MQPGNRLVHLLDRDPLPGDLAFQDPAQSSDVSVSRLEQDFTTVQHNKVDYITFFQLEVHAD